MSKKRIFSGIQPTGEIHIGNYVGAIKNWIALIDEYDAIFSIVDLHALTIENNPDKFHDNIISCARTLIACGLVPEKCRLFIQSHVQEHTELAWIFNCLTPLGDLERMTQFKDKSEQHKSNINAGLLTYPLLQAADILLYKAEYVPVGEDQIQHIEMTRRTAKRFNNRFGKTFPEPRELLTDTAKILGVDGKTKMSKSLNNHIGILEPPEIIKEKLKTAVTDENRKRRKDPGNPEICNIFTIHKAFSTREHRQHIDTQCRTAGIGCIECKTGLFETMMTEIEPIQKKALDMNSDDIVEILRQNASVCRTTAAGVMDEVRSKIGIRQ